MKHNDWISVNDRLPKLNKRVLVVRDCNGEQFVDIATRVKTDVYLHNIDKWYTDTGFDTEDVTHWKPIVLPKKK